MATSDELFPDQVDEFEDDWYRFRGLLPHSEREHWDVLVDRAKNRPYPGHCQLAAVDDDPKWPIVFTMLVTQQAEISRLREQLHELEQSQAAES
jgi:hypothetical protein